VLFIRAGSTKVRSENERLQNDKIHKSARKCNRNSHLQTDNEINTLKNARTVGIILQEPVVLLP
jgi:hypothetical protein